MISKRPDFFIFEGHNIKTLQELPPNYFHVTVTSPPYYGLRNYGDGEYRQIWLRKGRGFSCTVNDDHVWESDGKAGEFCTRCEAWRGELGLEPTPDLYIEHLIEVFREVRRVVRDDGTLWVNIGDSYAGSGKAGKNPEYHARHKMFSKSAKHKETFGVPMGIPDGCKAKDLMMIPAMFAIAMRQDGWYLRSEIIWHKKGGMPERVQDRPTSAHEKIFLFSKKKNYFYDWYAAMEDSTTGVGKRNQRNVWSLDSEHFQGAHFAVMPTEIPRRAITAGASEKGCCPVCFAPFRRIIEKGWVGDIADDPTLGLDIERPQARRAIEIFNKSGLTAEHLEAIRAVGIADAGKAQETMGGAGKNTQDILLLAEEAKAVLKGYFREFTMQQPRMLGWEPTCQCHPAQAGETVPCHVLDPFNGSGTSGLVALQMGCEYTGLELIPRFALMARERLQGAFKLPERKKTPSVKNGVESAQSTLFDLAD